MFVGEIIGVSGSTLSVRTGGVVIPPSRLWISRSFFRWNETRTALQPDPEAFVVGARVALLSPNGQDYYLLERMMACG